MKLSVVFWFLCGSFLLVSASTDTILIERFISELEEYFYNEIVGLIVQKDDLLPLLDFPESLSHDLSTRDSVNAKNLLYFTSRHFDEKKHLIRNIFSVFHELDYIKILLMKFCSSFEKSYTLLKIQQGKKCGKFAELDHLIFDIDLDFESYCRNNPSLLQIEENDKRDINFEAYWKVLLEVFEVFQDAKDRFLDECKQLNCIDLFADLSFFLKTLMERLKKRHNQLDKSCFDSALFFFSQATDSYFTSRYNEIEKLNEEARILAKTLTELIDNSWLNALEKIDALDKETTTRNWEIIGTKILDCRQVFSGGPLISSRVVSSALRIIQNIHLYCSNNVDKQIPFDLEKLTRFVDLSVQNFLEGYRKESTDFVLISVLNEFETAIYSTIGSKPPKFDESKKAEFSGKLMKMRLDDQNEVQECLNQFCLASDKLLKSWLEAKIFSEEEDYFHFFRNEILFFRDEIKACARQKSFHQYTGEQFILDLIDLIQDKIDSMRLFPTLREIFQEFITEFYKREFFSKVTLDSANSKLTIQANPFIIQADELLNNPEDILSQISDMPDSSSKDESVQQVIAIYSDFIDKEFTKFNNSNLKDIISQAISGKL